MTKYTEPQLDTLIAALSLYAESLEEYIATQKDVPAYRRAPDELLVLFSGRIEFCKSQIRKFGDQSISLIIDAAFDTPAKPTPINPELAGEIGDNELVQPSAKKSRRARKPS